MHKLKVKYLDDSETTLNLYLQIYILINSLIYFARYVIIFKMIFSFCSIASGSKGNCYFLSDGSEVALIDMGVSATYVERALKVLGVNADRVSVLVTHTHTDHTAGLNIFVKRHPSTKVYCSEQSSYKLTALLGRANTFVINNSLNLGGIEVNPFQLSHDVPCVGYKLSKLGRSVGIATDTGYATHDMINRLCGCDFVVIESNHDLAMLEYSSYPYILKERIRSPRGHLSNADAAIAMKTLHNDGGVKHFMLAHLSQENNSPECALNCAREAVGYDVELDIAMQDNMSALYDIN